MKPPPDQASLGDDPRLIDAAQRYLAELEAGRRPDRDAFMARFPDVREALGPYLDALEMVHGAAPLIHSTPRTAVHAMEGLAAEPLGDFHLVREIGRGGMGVVYEAVQRSLGRRVALKVLPFAAALDARQLQRFRNEAQAAAHLHHQNIVPVYAVGAERGVHFYAMQLIEGQNLAAVIAELAPDREGRPGAVPWPSAERTEAYRIRPAPALAGQVATHPRLAAQLTTQRAQRASGFFHTVVELVAQAAEALDYAHGLGIVHRDIKPGNLLVDDRGNLWITDFGLAQFQANAGLTQTGDLLGTLRYMSPEQAGGQRILIDHRTDIYSLGATLYELLTLKPIFDGEDRQTLLNQIVQTEPRPPRVIDRTIPQELETIVLKAVNKAPTDRYATAREVAEDLRRFLRNEPILARRPTLLQRGRKWLRRHPSVVIAGALLLILTTVGSLLSAWLIGDEREKTREAYELERQRAEVVEEQFRIARRAVHEMITLAETELADRPDLQGLRKRLLESALAHYQQFIDQRRDDPAAHEELRETKARVERILADLAVLQGAGQLFLLGQREVQDDLRVNAEQRRQIAELHEEHLQALKPLGKLASADRDQALVRQAGKEDAAIHSILTAKQVLRFGQIALQVQGPTALREPDIARALKLTQEQERQLRAVEAEVNIDLELLAHMPKGFGPPKGKGPFGGFGPGGFGPGGFGPKGKGPPPEVRKAWRELRSKINRRIHEVLTAEQVRQWHAMVGEPYEGPVMIVPRFPIVAGRNPPPGPPPDGPPRD
jgi:serine/threonine protein kinase